MQMSSFIIHHTIFRVKIFAHSLEMPAVGRSPLMEVPLYFVC